MLLCAVAPLFCCRKALSQQLTVQGQVLEKTERSGIAGISVAVAGFTVISGANGNFRIDGVSPGRHVITARGLGYTTSEVAIFVFSDTTLAIELEIAPVVIDTLEIRARQVRLRGEVREKRSRIGLVDATVVVSDKYQIQTDPIGRFDIRKLPSGIPVDLTVQNFGYVPMKMTLTPQRDTALVFELAEDPVAAQMIATQLARLDRRSEGRRMRNSGVLDRRFLLGNLNAPIKTVLEDHLRRTVGRGAVVCIVIDEVAKHTNARLIETMLPDRVERIEILEYPRASSNRMLMIRIYTRDFVREMIRGRATLVSRDAVLTHQAGRCA